jgi:DNA-binding transcriptional LysR family regulator
MDTIDGMNTVIAVVETGSFTAASERLGLSKALVSKYVGEVEKRLGVRLFNRSTRRLALTEAGQNYYDRVLPLLDEYHSMLDDVAGEQSQPRGILRISTPVTFGEMELSPRLPGFLQEHPDLNVDLQLTDRMIDMLEEGIDVVVRIGSVDDSNLVARHIKTYPLILCASPEYLKKNGTPRSPRQLPDHHCIIDSNFRIARQWPLVKTDGTMQTVEVQSRVAVNSPRAVREITIAGGGIGLIPRFIIEDALQEGLVKQVLPKYTTLEFGMYAIYPHRRYLSRKVRCFIDFLVREFGE